MPARNPVVALERTFGKMFPAAAERTVMTTNALKAAENIWLLEFVIAV